MKIFITGGSGFVGGAIIRHLKDQHDLWAMARSEVSAQKVADWGAEAVRCDLNSVQAEDLSGAEVVIHAAAHVAPWGNWSTFREFNVEGTRRMLAAAQEVGVKRFIHVSTDTVLFKGQDLQNVDESHPYPDKSPFPYPQTKREAEELVLAANNTAGMETLSLRPRFVWGPGDTTLLSNLCEAVDSGNFRWINQGKAHTSTCYIDNFSHATELALTRGEPGSAYFITDGQDCSMREIIGKMLATTGREAPKKSLNAGLARFVAGGVETVWKVFGIQKKPPVTRFSVAVIACDATFKIDKAQKELGYQVRYTVEEGMAIMRDFYAQSHVNQ